MNPVDVGSLLRLLKTFLTPEQYRELMLIIRELMENPRSADVTVWGAHLMAWIRLHYPQLEGLMQAIIDRLAASAAAAEAEAAAALMVEIAAILALIAITAGAIYITVDELTTPLLTTGGGKSCASNTPAAVAMATVQRTVIVYAWGKDGRSIKQSKLRRLCVTLTKPLVQVAGVRREQAANLRWLFSASRPQAIL